MRTSPGPKLLTSARIKNANFPYKYIYISYICFVHTGMAHSERVQSWPQIKPKDLATCACCDKTFPLTFVILFAVVVLPRIVAVVVVNWSGLVWSVCQSSARDLLHRNINSLRISLLPCRAIVWLQLKSNLEICVFCFPFSEKPRIIFAPSWSPLLATPPLLAYPFITKDKHNMVCSTP